MIDDGTVKNERIYKPHEEKFIVKTTYDNSDVLDANKKQRNQYNKHEQYKGKFVHAGRIHEGDVIRLKNLGYNLLSPDPEEWKRALLYIQTNEPHLLTVDGKPFAKNRERWV